MSELEGCGFPKGPGERSKERSQWWKCGVAELAERACNSGESRSPLSGKFSIGSS